TVTITAAVVKAVWDMGNGDTVECDNPGTKHTGQAGRSPTCGYDGYGRASGRGGYRITASTHWQVTWVTGSGVTGGFPDITRTSPTVPIRITELQVVTQ
ncbi:hypothetical protein ACFQ0D_36440, partial [Micromonospora zhanjiangensis]